VGQSDVMDVLSKSTEPLTVKQIAEVVGLNCGSVSRCVSCLYEEDFLIRHLIPTKTRNIFAYSIKSKKKR
jgi:hypothetical protein